MLLFFFFFALYTYTQASTLSAVVRRVGQPDLLFPTVCSAPCHALFGAIEGSVCTCACPEETPVYLHTAGNCVERLDECDRTVEFSQSGKLPVVHLPPNGTQILPRETLVWETAGIRSALNCSVSDVFFDGASHRWRSRRGIFQLSRQKTGVVFIGSDMDGTDLEGSVVQLKVFCPNMTINHLCISFRIVGTSGSTPSNLPSSGWATISLSVFCALLLVALAATLLGWHLSWKRKKQRLISNLQLQFFYQYQQQAIRQSHAQLDEGEVEFGSPSSLPKKKPYFCSEFLDRDHMINPPPMAEHFLEDLRRWMEAVHGRIRLKRFVPMLISIPESIEESQETQNDVGADSPVSSRSVDSGRESTDSDDSREDVRNEEIVLARMTIVKTPSPTSTLEMKERESRSISRPTSQIPVLLGAASPRPRFRGRGYAVFPGDALRSKSLPRRAQKSSIPRPT